MKDKEEGLKWVWVREEGRERERGVVEGGDGGKKGREERRE